MSERLLARILAFAIFLGAAASLGFGQPAKNSTASTYKTNCVSCHGQDGRGSAVGKSLHTADFHSAQVQQQSDGQSHSGALRLGGEEGIEDLLRLFWL